MLKTLRNASILRTLPYSFSELCHVQNFGKFMTEAYSESCLVKHIPAYSIIIVIITLTFFFITLILHTFQRNSKRHTFLTTLRSNSMLD